MRRLRRRLNGDDLTAIADVRRSLREALSHWDAHDLVDTAELLASELVTNALVHSGGDATVTATLSPGPEARLRVEVHDGGPRLPAPRDAGEDATSGRGLLLVSALADEWGARPVARGKVVWFELCAQAA
ncbi:ATP-binding protein [Streptomyces sp. SCUT-3]|uniref:ATP-binding protein n=1 Tax=Streptomyces TaxID=1883 RepID=UPI000CAB4453|nr:ATP-binding protein [Streptomyces sp. SCUT-3]PLW73166.1 hypothetical protein C0036_08700 [Streptomyces sp. DJ]QMV24894.1 ATP-binding protein [Streptomyces sp. SCUT-3]